METVEPNVFGAGIFALMAYVTCLAGVVVSGVFPLETRPELRRPAGFALIAANLVLLCAATCGLVFFGIDALRWTSVVILCGLALLFAPGLFNVWPSQLRDGQFGLAITAVSLVLVMVLTLTLSSSGVL